MDTSMWFNRFHDENNGIHPTTSVGRNTEGAWRKVGKTTDTIAFKQQIQKEDRTEREGVMRWLFQRARPCSDAEPRGTRRATPASSRCLVEPNKWEGVSEGREKIGCYGGKWRGGVVRGRKRWREKGRRGCSRSYRGIPMRRTMCIMRNRWRISPTRLFIVHVVRIKRGHGV